MKRSTSSLVLALALTGLGAGEALAQDEEPYEEGAPAEEGAPYEEETQAPYDDYDIEGGGDPGGEAPYEEGGEPAYEGGEGGEAPYDGPPGGAPVSAEAGSVDDFYDELAPHGEWVENDTYGLVWSPHRSVVGAEFVPYSTSGSWQYTDSGWMFASEYKWGWAPFHYGRWYRDPHRGWCWVPGSVWAPSWVDWRFGGGYVGWAPLPPRHHKTVWVFANARDIHRPHIHRYVVRPHSRYYRATVPVRHRIRSGRASWYFGPKRVDVERVGRIRVRPYRFRPPRAGVVTRVRFDGGRFRTERVTRARSRRISGSRYSARRHGSGRTDVRRDQRYPDRRDHRTGRDPYQRPGSRDHRTGRDPYQRPGSRDHRTGRDPYQRPGSRDHRTGRDPYQRPGSRDHRTGRDPYQKPGSRDHRTGRDPYQRPARDHGSQRGSYPSGRTDRQRPARTDRGQQGHDSRRRSSGSARPDRSGSDRSDRSDSRRGNRGRRDR